MLPRFTVLIWILSNLFAHDADACRDYLRWLQQMENAVYVSESDVGSASVSISEPNGSSALSFSRIGSLSVSASDQGAVCLALAGVSSASVSLKHVDCAHVSASDVGSLSISMKGVPHASVSVSHAGAVSLSIHRRPKLQIPPGMLVLIPLEGAEMGRSSFLNWQVWDETLIQDSHHFTDLWKSLIREELVIVRFSAGDKERWTFRHLHDLQAELPGHPHTKLEADSLGDLIQMTAPML